MTLRQRLLHLRYLKDAGSCTDCDGSFPYYCMDFDHVPERGLKRFELNPGSGGIRASFSDDEFYAEILKCDLVCAVCHRKRTYERKPGEGHARATAPYTGVCKRGHDLHDPSNVRFSNGRNRGCRPCNNIDSNERSRLRREVS